MSTSKKGVVISRDSAVRYADSLRKVLDSQEDSLARAHLLGLLKTLDAANK